MQCPPFHTLLEFVDGPAAPGARQAVARHLEAGCPSCAGVVEWYGAARAAARSDRAPDPPPWLAGRTLAAIREAREAASERGIRGFVTRIRGALRTDSLSPSPALSRGAEDARQLLYSAEPFDVDLLVAEADGPDRLRLAGQVLATDDVEEGEPLRVELALGGAVTAVAETSAVGEFTFDGVPPGRYDLHIVGERREILLADVPVSLE